MAGNSSELGASTNQLFTVLQCPAIRPAERPVNRPVMGNYCSLKPVPSWAIVGGLSIIEVGKLLKSKSEKISVKCTRVVNVKVGY